MNLIEKKLLIFESEHAGEITPDQRDYLLNKLVITESGDKHTKVFKDGDLEKMTYLTTVQTCKSTILSEKTSDITRRLYTKKLISAIKDSTNTNADKKILVNVFISDLVQHMNKSTDKQYKASCQHSISSLRSASFTENDD
jgi:hypothetical protein